MRKFVNLLVFVMVFSFVGPYFAEAKENTADSSQYEIGNENIGNDTTHIQSENPNSQVNQPDIEESSENEIGEMDLNESIENEDELSKDNTSLDQSNGSNVENKSELTENKIEQVDESNVVDNEHAPSKSKQKSVEENIDVQKEAEEKSTKLQIKETATSKLGHINSSAVKIYKDLTNTSFFFTAGSYTNSVYYIKKQAVIENQTYYLLSKKPSGVEGTVGWVKSSDLSTQSHVGVDKKAKTFYIKGTGSAYSKVWGGSKDRVYTLSNYKGQAFEIHLTEKVGNTIWYRGVLAGKTVWIQSSHLTEVDTLESAISKLGHINSGKVKIHKDYMDTSTFITAGSTYTNAVYYIKKQAIYDGVTYYLLSKNPSSEKGIVGWVKSTDLSIQTHVGVDKKAKTFYIKGTGSAYSKVWGGSKDRIYTNLSNYKGQAFEIHLTEKVGNTIWYRGVLAGKTIWIQSSYVIDKNSLESVTSKLGHINSGKVRIYKDYMNTSNYIAAGTTYTNAVYYIKKQAVYGGVTYYLISKSPSSEKGVIGWVKSTDLSTQSHVGADKKAKTFYIKGTGSAYSKVWGGSKDLVYTNLSNYKSRVFEVHLTEKVGNTIWYRGVLAGKTVWIQSSYVIVIDKDSLESSTSKLGHINSGKVKIYKDYIDTSNYIVAGASYTNAVYYIKKQAVYGGVTYYLISENPSSEKGVVGWIKSTDLSTQSHVGVDKKAKTFYIRGTGSAYSKIWGGSKDRVYANLSSYQNEDFKINLTEKVGNNTWHRGILGGKTVWIQAAYLHQGSVVLKSYTGYNITLNKMLEIQMDESPQTDVDDKKDKVWLREDAFKSGSIANGKGTVEGDKWNLRDGPGTGYSVRGEVVGGAVLTISDSSKGTDGYTWYLVVNLSGWFVAKPEPVKYYLNPSNFTGTLKDSLQFVKLSESANLNVTEVNQKILSGTGILSGKAKTFIDAAQANGVNEIYLISHSLLETGNGNSQLAKGVEVGRDNKGNLVVATDSNRDNLTAIKKTYNMYGIGAFDNKALVGGATYAYEKGWFTPEAAINGGAAFIGDGYVNVGQDTLYKMRWNPLYASINGEASHQYATDIGWSYKQTSKMYELYQLLDEYRIILDIPKYI